LILPSQVAAAKRGLVLDAIYFHSPPYVGEKSKGKVLTLARTLGRWQAVRSLTVVGFTDLQKRPARGRPASGRRPLSARHDAHRGRRRDTTAPRLWSPGKNLGR